HAGEFNAPGGPPSFERTGLEKCEGRRALAVVFRQLDRERVQKNRSRFSLTRRTRCSICLMSRGSGPVRGQHAPERSVFLTSRVWTLFTDHFRNWHKAPRGPERSDVIFRKRCGSKRVAPPHWTRGARVAAPDVVDGARSRRRIALG